MARRKFEDGFKERAVAYCQEHPEKTMKACAADLDIGYSTLRRWVVQVEEAKAVADKVGDEPTEQETVTNETEGSAASNESNEVADASTNPEGSESEKVEVEADQEDPAAEEEVVASAEESESSMSAKKEPQDDSTIGPSVAEVYDALEDERLFSSIGLNMGSSANVHPHDEDYDLRCKSHPSTYKNIQHMAGDMIVSVSAQIGNVVEDISDSVSNVAGRLSLYKKRHDLKKERKILKKEKQKRLNR